ncbi:hypothetical protein CMO83_01655 [Candidatus Woesearchaeota archaeon]|jgi:chromosome segregation ATPase|nr:hypothetical protein [Candidatus Woesearchaeota archaeon]MDP6648016.1 hypothetical protein [Candidatus Woesearchaeota archaeon]|tara:strand:+ start:53649 stop:54926 length:1278 start_codon:yes stop_codon:yes gene_type:complete
MLEFLKKIFLTDVEEEVKKPLTEINLQNLEEWINEKIKPLTEEINQKSKEVLMKVNEEVQRTRFNLEVLENSKLQNPNIPFRAKQYMEGNRKAYMKSINGFLGRMEINNNDYFYLVNFCKEFDELMDVLNKSTLKSYTILQEFFANETIKIAQNLKNFDTLFKELKSALNNDMVVAANKSKEKIQRLIAKTKQKINLDVDFKSLEANVKLANDEKNKIMEEIDKFNDSEEHKNFLNLQEEKKNKENSFQNDENQILQSFAVLDRPLRKYSHVVFEHEEIVLDYIKHPIEALASDKELKITEVLKNLEKKLNENKLQLDDKKKEKALDEVKKLNKEFIEQFLKKYSTFKSEIENLDNKMKVTRVADKLKELNKKLEEANSTIEKSTKDFEQLKNETAKAETAVSELKDEVEESIKRIFAESIKVAV